MRYLFLLLFTPLILSCSPKEPLYNTQTYVFGTLVDISIYGETEAHAQTVANTIINNYNTLHQRLHAWQASEVSAINESFAHGQSINIEPDVAKMIHEMTALSIQSGGAFNPAIGHLIKAWGFHSDEFKPQKIDAEKIKQLVSDNPSMSDIQIANGKASSKNIAIKLDLGGYAKGYALDQGLAYLREQKIQHALINIGGNIIALGQHGDRPWQVGIQHPRQPNAIASVALASGWAIGTSGDYQRFFDLDGKRYCHIINPETGYPAQGIQSVTVMIPPQSDSGVRSDVASKPIFLAAPAKRIEAAQAMGVEYFLMIDSDNNVQVSANMQEQLNWLDPEQQYEVISLD